MERKGAMPLEGRVAWLILLVVVSVCVVLCVLCCLQNNPVFSSVTISHILKNENYELCFMVGSFVNQITNYDRKRGTVVWPLVGMFGGSMSLDCFGGFLDQKITTGKKVQSSIMQTSANTHWFPK
jgi:hypothetical protein